MPSDDHPSVSSRFRIMELKLRISEWKRANNNGKFYMNLWIEPERKLRTKLVPIKRGKTKIDWQERFIFSVSDKFINGDSNFTVEIYEKRNLRHDLLVGSGNYDLRSLFSEKEKDPVYDDSDDEIAEKGGGGGEKEGEKGGEEVKSLGGIEVRNGGSWKASVGFEAVIWKGFIKSVGVTGTGRRNEVAKCGYGV